MVAAGRVVAQVVAGRMGRMVMADLVAGGEEDGSDLEWALGSMVMDQ